MTLLRLESVVHDAERPAGKGGPIYWVNQAVAWDVSTGCCAAPVWHNPEFRARESVPMGAREVSWVIRNRTWRTPDVRPFDILTLSVLAWRWPEAVLFRDLCGWTGLGVRRQLAALHKLKGLELAEFDGESAQFVPFEEEPS